MQRSSSAGQVATSQRYSGYEAFTPLPCRLAATFDDLAHARFMAKQSFPIRRIFFNAAAARPVYLSPVPCYSPFRFEGRGMTGNASGVDENAANHAEDQANAALGAYNGDMADYMSNVNSAIASGNPFESKDYLTKQNIETSGAMNAENAAAKNALDTTARRTGTNTAALADTVASSARQGQRDLTNFNAARDTSNEQNWLAQRDQLMRDQLAGANSEAGVYGTGTGANTSDLKSMTDAQAAEDQMWVGLADAAAQGAGAAAGA